MHARGYTGVWSVIYIYTHMYAYIYIHMYKYVYTYIYIYVFKYFYIICICIHICAFVNLIPISTLSPGTQTVGPSEFDLHVLLDLA